MSASDYSADIRAVPENGTAGRSSILAWCRARPRITLLWIAYLALAAVLALPILLVEVPLSSDTLNHLVLFFLPRDMLTRPGML